MKAPKQQEYGRTMVEMLASLSIMGLLGVGVIWAFNSVVEKFRITSLSEEISARAIYASSKFKSQSKNQVVFKEFKHDYALGQFEKSTTLVNNTFTIVINKIEDDICQKVKKRFEEQNTAALFVCNLEQQKALITFYKSLKPTSNNPIVPCNSDDMCGACEICGEYGFCESGCPQGSQCAKDFDTPTNGKSCCPNENVVDGACCANPDGYGNCCDSSGGNCCPPDKPILGKNGTCYACDENIKIEVDERTQKCSRCKNRTYRSATYNHIGWCVPNECPDDKPLMSYDGICYECSERVFMRDAVNNGSGDNTTCSKCPDENALFDDRICLVCPEDMVVKDGVCTCEEGFMAGYTGNNIPPKTQNDPTCFSCGEDYLNSIGFWRKNAQNVCGVCPNRIVVDPKTNYYYYCALETCPIGYMHNRYGSCLSCSQASNIEFKPSSLENSCSECGGFRYTDGNYCKKCPTEGTTSWTNLTQEQQAECLAEKCSYENECIAYNPDTNSCEDMCQQVEYLESTGTQYIDTGMLSTASSTVNVVFGLESAASGSSNNGAIFGGRNAQTSGTFTFFRIASSTPQYFRFDYHSQRSVATANNFSIDTASKYVFNYNGSTATATNTTEGKGMSITVSPASTFSNYPIALFAVNTAGSIGTYFKGRIYSYNYSDGSNSIDFVPVISPDGEPCMFDKVSKKLFYNKGSGTFKTNLDE